MSDAAIFAGFANPVEDAQRTFRALLDALAHPGTVSKTTPPEETPDAMPPAMTAVALTLADAGTPLWLSPTLAGAADNLRFHCGCPIAEQPERAAFAFAVAAESPPIAALSATDERWPERDTTLVMAVASIGRGPSFQLTGPGIPERATLRCAGLPAGFKVAWTANHRRYPLGCDLFLVAGDRVVGLPRSVSIGEEPACTFR